MKTEYKLKLISAYNYYKTMVEFYGLEHSRTRSALITLIDCYRSRFKPENVEFGLVRGLEGEVTGTYKWEDLK